MVKLSAAQSANFGKRQVKETGLLTMASQSLGRPCVICKDPRGR